MSSSPLFLLPIISSFLYLGLRCFESYYWVNTEDVGEKILQIPLKLIIRETMLVFLSSLIANAGFLFFSNHAKQFINVLTETKSLIPEDSPLIFMDQPNF